MMKSLDKQACVIIVVENVGRMACKGHMFPIMSVAVTTLFGYHWLCGCFDSKCLWEIVMETVAILCKYCTGGYLINFLCLYCMCLLYVCVGSRDGSSSEVSVCVGCV